MHIGAVAEQTELSLRTLRHYDEVGLLRPSGRTTGGFRLYTEQDVERLFLIRRMKPLGFTLDQMGELLRLTESLAESPDVESQARLEEFIVDAQARRKKLAYTLEIADEFIDRLQQQHDQSR
ncbi:MerR family transcriptional regulator [Nesterenkonia salmonea]|uniref:MerR family transcriptional regulator n=1 Tax=Nesterenkonia salmonea TaxID=1804987 RepID=A0A5R9B7G3_9MICC|nr:MerR family transcriptional regulator [Nesterenkonia salmonea]TLP92882.1 MerR family transcriptional regulator [Nesterenkonia salmonea]